MRFFAVAAALVSAVSAETFTVIVGENAGLTYTPSTVTAKVGDTVAFQFVSKNHTVTQSTFAKPCEKMTTPTAGVDSGFLPVAANASAFPEWSFTIDNASAPMWFYCAQTPHCSKGMVFSLNPTAEKTHEAFLATALASATTTNTTTGSTSASGTSASGTSSASGTLTPSASATTINQNSGALSLSGSTAMILSAAGIVAGLVL